MNRKSHTHKGNAKASREKRAWRPSQKRRRKGPAPRQPCGGESRQAELEQQYAELKKARADRDRLEQELRATERRLRYQLAETPALLYIGKLDRPPRATFVSENIRALLGYEPKEVTADPEFWPRHVHPDDAPGIEASFATIFREGSNVWEYRLRDKAGNYHWVRDHLRLVRDATGRPVELLGCAVDITERKRAEQALREAHDTLESRVRERTAELESANAALRASEATLQAFYDSSPFLMGVAELAGEETMLLSGNAAVVRLLGYRSTRSADQARRERVTPPEVGSLFVEQCQRCLRDGTPVHFEFEYPTPDGNRSHSATVAFLGNGPHGHPRFSFISQDITERVRLERQIMEIGDRVQVNFGQEIHDGLCQMLVSAAFDANDLCQRVSAGAPAEKATLQRLCSVLDDAITAARRLSRGLFPVRLNQDGLITALQDLVQSLGRHTNLRVRFREVGGPVSITDNVAAIHLFRIAQEAMNNAFKHAHARHIVVRLARARHSITLTVTDDGVGLSSAGRCETGLGLYIMDYRARALGGTLQVQARPGGGTVVVCRIPQPLPQRIPSAPLPPRD